MSQRNGKSETQLKPPTAWVAQVFNQLECQLVAYVSRRVSSLETAQDIVQEAFVKLCQQEWPAIQDHTKAWLYKTCRNRAIDISKREGRMNVVHHGTDVSILRDTGADQVEENAVHDERLAQVRSEIEQLPEKQQEVLRLRLHDGLSYKQIAEVTGLSVTNVGYLLHQAVNSLRGRLQVE